jgi:transcriptional regulator PpsR
MLDHPDITLVLDNDAVIQQVTVSNTVSGEFVKSWLGRPWIETVADSGVDKVQRSLEDAQAGGVSAYRRIVQRFPSGLELPIEYTTVRLADSGGMVAVGRSLQASSEMESRLIAAQQAMERDYWKLREVETRYRLLFDASNEAVLVLSADDLRVTEANPAAIRALGVTSGWEFLGEMAPRERDSFRVMLDKAREGGRAPGGVFHIGARQAPWMISASVMNDNAALFYMLQLVPADGQAALASESVAKIDIVQHIPDAVVAIGRDGIVQSANQAFLKMVKVEDADDVIGLRLDRWLGRPGADLAAILSDVRANGQARRLAATIRDRSGAPHSIEVSAGGDPSDEAGSIALVLREPSAARPDAPATGSQPTLPALTSAGKTPLKSLVQAAVSVVERHYVESALAITEGNRTAAAERLGLSRQSLYAKLNRYGLD